MEADLGGGGAAAEEQLNFSFTCPRKGRFTVGAKLRQSGGGHFVKTTS